MIKLRRIISGGSFIPQIDGLRFVAIFSVVLFHLHGSLMHNGAVPSPFEGSGEKLHTIGILSKRGVELFFVISGFILGLPFAKSRLYGEKPVKLGAYYLRRITRLEPVYFVNLVLSAVAYVVAGQLRVHDALTHFLPSLLYLHQAIYGVPSIISELTWSLEVEVQFYVLVPLLTAVFFIERAALRRGILAGTMLVWSILSLRLAETHLQHSILYYLPFFVAGLLICDLYLAHAVQWKAGYVWDLAGIVGWLLMGILGLDMGHLALPFVIVLLFLSVFRGKISSQLFSISWITNIGGMCYTIYLYHFILMSTIGKITKRFYFGGGFGGYYALQAVLMLPGILGCCVILFLLIERPCMDKTWPGKFATWITGLAGRDRKDVAPATAES